MSDRIFGLAVLALAGFFAFSASQLPAPFFADPVGPKTFPYLVAGVSGICGLVMLLRPDPDPDWPGLGTLANLGIATAVMIVYAYMLVPMGFLAPTVVAAGILSWQISGRPVFAALTGVGLAIGLFILFRYALGLSLRPLPEGWL